ncbi:MAG: HAMP domain-containing histidine kinase [Spirochaetales bacterium]|nr:HAMP domain-containing histidine kinase [Spirochaetales bacterium]
MEDIFKNEHDTLQHGTDILSRKELASGELWEEYAELHRKYQSLLDLSAKLTKIGDRYQKKALTANIALKLSEQKLKELNATKDTFFSIIAHDLKNPLTIIMGFSELLVDTWERISEEDRRAQVEKISEASGSLFKLLNNLLDWARLQTGGMQFKPEEHNIKTIIDETVALLGPGAEAKNITLAAELKDDLIIRMDQEMIRTVIRNLTSNAIKFTTPGGAVTISVHKGTESIELVVTDTGIGMSEENLSKLFRIDAHYTTKGTANEKGTGLGLILCKEFIEKHNGAIRVESEKGLGSRFIVSLPV